MATREPDSIFTRRGVNPRLLLYSSKALTQIFTWLKSSLLPQRYIPPTVKDWVVHICCGILQQTYLPEYKPMLVCVCMQIQIWTNFKRSSVPPADVKTGLITRRTCYKIMGSLSWCLHARLYRLCFWMYTRHLLIWRLCLVKWLKEKHNLRVSSDARIAFVAGSVQDIKVCALRLPPLTSQLQITLVMHNDTCFLSDLIPKITQSGIANKSANTDPCKA